MPSTLSRYIARHYFTNIVVLLVLLCSFVMMVDVSVNLGRYAKAAARLNGGEDGWGFASILRTAMVIGDLWWPRLIQLYCYILGIVLVGAMGFTFTQLSRQRELVAMLAGGVSMFRASRPVLFVAAGLMLVQVGLQEFAMPRIAPLLARDAGDAGSRDTSAFALKLTADSSGSLWSIHRFDPATGAAEGVNIIERDEAGRAKRRISAERASFDGGGWVLTGPSVMSLTAPSAPGRGGAGGTGVGATAETVPTRMKTDLDPTAILASHYSDYSSSLSWRQIGQILRSPTVKPEMHDRLSRIGWGRLSALVCAVLSLLITMPFFLSREPENMLMAALKCAPVAILTLLAGLLGTTLAIPGLPPVVSVFVPVLVLGPLAMAALTSIKT